MKTINTILAGICAFFFLISGVIAITSSNLESKAFSAETYKKAFKDQGLYVDTPAILTDVILSSGQNLNEATALLSALSRDDLELMIASLLPSDELETVMDGLFDSTFAYLKSETDTLTISLLPFKRNMMGEGGVRAFTRILLTKPDCTPQQILEMGLGFFSAGSGFVFCNPPQEVIRVVQPLLEKELQLISLNIPDEMELVSTGQSGTSNLRARLDKVRAFMRLTPVVPLVMLLAITLLAVRGLTEWLKWWGLPLFVTGITTTFLALIGSPIVRLFLENVLLRGSENLPARLVDVIRNIFGSLIQQIVRPMAIEGIILTIIGMGMFLIAIFIKWKIESPPSLNNQERH